MTTDRFIELKLIEAIEYTKYSGETSWSFLLDIDDKKINFTGDVESEDVENFKLKNVRFITESLAGTKFRLEATHILELIEDLKKLELFDYANECILDLQTI